MSKKVKEYDQNIIQALKALPKPLKTFDGHDVLFNMDKRKETIFEHIANKNHHLHLVDIELIPIMLRNPSCLKTDRNGKKYRTYICKRKKNKERLKYLKISTLLSKDKIETVITIHAIKK